MLPTELLIGAYANGYFPMADEGGEIRWVLAGPARRRCRSTPSTSRAACSAF